MDSEQCPKVSDGLFQLLYSVEVGKEWMVSSAPDVLTACFGCFIL